MWGSESPVHSNTYRLQIRLIPPATGGKPQTKKETKALVYIRTSLKSNEAHIHFLLHQRKGMNPDKVEGFYNKYMTWTVTSYKDV